MKNIKFQINQLRLDKIIYGIEAVVANTSAYIVIVLATYLDLGRVFVILPAILSIIYTLYVFISNFMRLQKIIKLESKINRV